MNITFNREAIDYSDVQKVHMLKDQFNYYYQIIAESRLVPEARHEKMPHMVRSLSGILNPYNNMIMGKPDNDWDQVIDEQIAYFRKANLPFVWYFDVEGGEEFKKRLMAKGFTDGGIFKGVLGKLPEQFSQDEIPSGYQFEEVFDHKSFAQFNELVCQTFGLIGTAKDYYGDVMFKASQGQLQKIHHWVVKKEGKVISAVSTLIDGDKVSFWNGATLEEYRKQGLSTHLRHMALKQAVLKGCKIGMSFLMAEGLALGICSKLGYETKWQFHAFLAPK